MIKPILTAKANLSLSQKVQNSWIKIQNYVGYFVQFNGLPQFLQH